MKSQAGKVDMEFHSDTPQSCCENGPSSRQPCNAFSHQCPQPSAIRLGHDLGVRDPANPLATYGIKAIDLGCKHSSQAFREFDWRTGRREARCRSLSA